MHTTSVAISPAVADSFATTSVIIPNPYDARIFFPSATIGKRTGDLIFLGRLVTEKGVDLLLTALALLRDRSWFPRLTIVGDGPERGALQELTGKLNLSAQVLFVGSKRRSELADLLRAHKILVVPSRYHEPFGVVALEGIACGCIVVGSEGGGLREAIGPCGRTFANADPVTLADALERFLSFPDERASLLECASTHLAKFHPATIADAYLAVFRSKLT
jgi:glycosyltransferase involved in cell wall biosynthesis